jgi:molybdopterin synthase sulfur carrier subunit
VTTVRIPPTLRAEVGGARELQADGTTVLEVLRDLTERHPALGDRIWENGSVAEFVNVYVDGEDVRTLEGPDTAVRDGSSLILLPAMAGGSSPEMLVAFPARLV